MTEYHKLKYCLLFDTVPQKVTVNIHCCWYLQVSTGDLSTLWRQAADFHLRGGEPDVAAKSLEELLRINPDDKKTLAQLVMAYAQVSTQSVYITGYDLWFSDCMYVCVFYGWLTLFSVMTLDGRMSYFTGVAAIRQLLEVLLKWWKCWNNVTADILIIALSWKG